MSESTVFTSCLFCAEECSPTFTVINGEVHKLKPETNQVPILEKSWLVSNLEEIESIRENLEVIFILQEIFNYPSEKCLPYLSKYGGQMHPEHWFTICSTCRTSLHEGYCIRRKVTQLEKKLVEIKSKLKQSIFSSTKANQIKINHQPERIWNDLRNHVLQDIRGVTVTDVTKETSRSFPELFTETFYKSGAVNLGSTTSEVYHNHDYDARETKTNRITSPVLPSTMSDSEWYPSPFETKVEVEVEVKVDRNVQKHKLQRKRKRLNPATPKSRLKQSKPCKITTAKQNPVENPLENITHESQKQKNDTKQEESLLPINKRKKRIRKPKRIPCDECSSIFRLKTLLAEHKRSAHPTNSDSGEHFKCPECSKLFDTSQKILAHLNHIHRHRSKSKGSEVRWFRHGSVFKNVINKTGIPYYCDHCDTILSSRLRLVSHVNNHHDSRREAGCQHCDEKFESKQLLQFHLETDHPDVPEVVNAIHPKDEEIDQACPHCSESFPTKMKKDYHIAKFHQNTCPQCSHVTDGYWSLQKHLTTAHDIGEKKFICELCSKRYVDKDGLQCHRQVEHYKELGLTPLMCTICGLVSTTENNLKWHMRNVHEKLKTHFCEYCGKGFTFSADLQRHILLHTAPREEQYKKGPFFCQICNAKFNVRQGLYYHMKQKHNDTFSFRCDNCGKGYCSSNKLEQHKNKKSCKK